MTEEERQKPTECYTMIYSNTGGEEYLALVKDGDFDTIKKVKTFIVNNLGINLCSVAEIKVDKQGDGQLKEINIKFKPDNG